RPMIARRGSDPELRVEGLWEVVKSFFRDETPFLGTSRAYLRGALGTESRRTFSRREKADGDRLGLTPKLSSIETKDEASLRRETNRVATGSCRGVAQEGDSALELLIAAEDDRERRQVIETLRASLPDDMAALLAAWEAGESPSAARKRLGLRKS